ncbi:hypothetical protein CBL_21240, partial [Carabus blaptoides fortunei]
VSQELNKIKKKKSGSGTDEVYTSSWPYFSALQFLIPGLTSRSTTSNVGKFEKKGSKRKYASDDDNSKILKRALYIMQKDPDENDHFGEYVAMELKSLRFESNKRRLKSEIRRAISRIADEDDSNYSSSISTVPSPYPSPLHYPAQSPSPSSIIYLGSTENISCDSETDFQQLQ